MRFKGLIFLLINAVASHATASSLGLATQLHPAGELCETRSIMTLAWTICLYDTDKSKAELQEAIEKGMAELHRIDEWMSEWKPASLISRINANAGIGPVTVTDEAFSAISQSIHHSELTGGAFDITFNAFFGLYGWKKGHERFPTDDEIRKLLPLVNYRDVELNAKDKTVFLKRKGMKIGLGGMGEGWAVDKVVELLKPSHIKSGFVDGSGAVYFWGKKPDGKLWTVGVGDPRPDEKKADAQSAVLYKIYDTDFAITTANDREKSFVKNGKLYHHIIDPHTGQSADKSVQVTAICKTATLCDLADDGIFILGSDEGRRYAEKLGVLAVIVDAKKKITLTDGLKPLSTQWGPALVIDKARFATSEPLAP